MYKKTIWENNVTPVNADNMNKIENELESQSIKLDTIPDDIANELKDVSHFKGTIDNIEQLPTENVTNGDMYYSISEEVLAIAAVKENVTIWYETAELPEKLMTFKGIKFTNQSLPTENVKWGDTYFWTNSPDDPNAKIAIAYTNESGVPTWFKTPTIIVDSELSKTSLNPVQNKIITNELINLTQWQKAADDITIEAEAESQAITLNGNYAELMVKIEYPADTASSAASGQIEYKVTNANGTKTSIGVDSLNKGAKYILTTISNVMGNVVIENNSLQYKAQVSTSKRTQCVEITTHYLNNLTVSIPTDGWKLKVGTTIKIYGKKYFS